MNGSDQLTVDSKKSANSAIQHQIWTGDSSGNCKMSKIVGFSVTGPKLLT